MWFECKIGGTPDEWIDTMSWEQYVKLIKFFKLKHEKEKEEEKKNKK